MRQGQKAGDADVRTIMPYSDKNMACRYNFKFSALIILKISPGSSVDKTFLRH